jgi:hypothetical protein
MSIDNKIAIDFLIRAKEKGMSIFLEDGKLRYTITKGKSIDNKFVTELKNYKNEITAFLSSEAGDFELINAPEKSITKSDRPVSKRLPLSFSQERLWFIDRLEGSVQYHISAVLRLKGNLNVDALAAHCSKLWIGMKSSGQ